MRKVRGGGSGSLDAVPMLVVVDTCRTVWCVVLLLSYNSVGLWLKGCKGAWHAYMEKVRGIENGLL